MRDEQKSEQGDSRLWDEARVAAQDRGAALGMLHTQPDANGLGEAGTAAARAVLRHLRDDGGAWLTIEGAEYIDRVLEGDAPAESPRGTGRP